MSKEKITISSSSNKYLQTRPLTNKEVFEQILIELRKISRGVEAIQNKQSITITPPPTTPWVPCPNPYYPNTAPYNPCNPYTNPPYYPNTAPIPYAWCNNASEKPFVNIP